MKSHLQIHIMFSKLLPSTLIKSKVFTLESGLISEGVCVWRVSADVERREVRGLY